VRPTFFLLCALSLARALQAQEAAPPAPETTSHPAFFLVGDSITKTGTGNGESGPWGMGCEINDFQHTKKAGAQVNAAAVAEGLKRLSGCALAADLLASPAPAGSAP